MNVAVGSCGATCTCMSTVHHVYNMTDAYMYIHVCIHVLMRDEKEGRKKQARSNKQTRQSNTAHPRQSLFPRKMSCLGSTQTHDILHSRQSTLHVHVSTCSLTRQHKGIHLTLIHTHTHAYIHITPCPQLTMKGTNLVKCVTLVHNNCLC